MNQARSSGPSTSRAAGGAAGTCSRGARAKASDTAAGSALHHARVHATKESAGFGSQDIGVGDRKIVAGNCQVEIVLERKINRIFQGDIQSSILNQPIQPTGVRQCRFRNGVRLVGVQWIARLRHFKLQPHGTLPGGGFLSRIGLRHGLR